MDHPEPIPTDDSSSPADLTDEELTTLALAADPTAPLDPRAVPWQYNMSSDRNPLPDWYMPRPIATGRGRATKFVVISIVASILVINAAGLCITSGFLSLA